VVRRHAIVAGVQGPVEPFIGSQAVAWPALSRHQLRTRFRLVCPNGYLSKQIRRSLEHRIAVARLWSGRRATIAGAAAAALHGAKWIDDDVAVELIYPNPRTPPGVVSRRDLLLDDEVQKLTESNTTATTTGPTTGSTSRTSGGWRLWTVPSISCDGSGRRCNRGV
jgi:hypothetical protein